MVRSAKELDVFKKAHKLTIKLYKETKNFRNMKDLEL